MDSHAHLQHPRFGTDRDAVVARAVEAGIERILVPGWDLASSEAALLLADRYPEIVDAAVGVHPHHAAGMTEADWTSLESLGREARACAIGEIGLDFFRNLSPPDAQRDAFARQLSLATRIGLPVLVHQRDAQGDVTDALRAWPGPTGRVVRGVLHAFSGSVDMATELVRAGYLVSFALPVAFRSAAGPRAAATAIPAGSLLVETDAPYLGPDREARNEPSTVLRVIGEVARLRGQAPEDVAGASRDAYDRLVGRRSP